MGGSKGGNEGGVVRGREEVGRSKKLAPTNKNWPLCMYPHMYLGTQQNNTFLIPYMYYCISKNTVEKLPAL